MRTAFWVRSACRNALAILGGSLIWSVMMGLMGVTEDLPELLRSTGGFLMMFGGLMLAFQALNLYKLCLPLALGSGSTRREAVVGIGCYRAVSIALVTAGVCAFFLLSDPLVAGVIAPCVLGILLIMDAIGNLIGAAGVRLGTRAQVWLGVAMVVLTIGTAVGVCVLFFSTADRPAELPLWVQLSLPAAGLAAHGLSFLPVKRVVYTYCVKL